jgi:hypothetical protein
MSATLTLHGPNGPASAPVDLDGRSFTLSDGELVLVGEVTFRATEAIPAGIARIETWFGTVPLPLPYAVRPGDPVTTDLVIVPHGVTP